MAKKIRAIALFLICLIVAAASCSVSVIQGQTIDGVENVSMVKNTESSFTLNWKKVHKAAGYRVYSYDDDTKQYKKMLDINDANAHSYNFDNLDSASIYNIKISAFKIFNKKEYESELSKEITAYSLPAAVNCDAVSSYANTLSVYWDRIPNAAGYEIEYSQKESFKDSKVENVENSEECSLLVEKLNPSDVYYTRARAYMKVNGETVYGQWGKASNATIRDEVVIGSNIDPDKPMIAFSFDDGPAFDDNGTNSTERILKVLEKYGARATFFMVGDRVNNDTAYLLKEELKLGCELGNHTFSHSHYGSDVTASDISKASERIKKYSGSAPTIFRCPGGKITKTIKDECKRESMPLAYWSVDTEDWKSKDAKKIYNKAMDGIYDGAIILMHDIYPTTADAVEKLVPALIKKGYQIVTVSELITVKSGKSPKVGEQYVDCVTINNNTK
ncbi:MAG: polysaccharide deacetylase family protein [Eubacterium sp.]